MTTQGPDERERFMEEALKKMNIKRQHLSRDELEKEIIDFLSKKQPCSLATSSLDGTPRISVVDFANDGLDIYIFSEGGGKFKNLKENNRVAVGIGTGTRATKTRGVNIWGIGEVFTDDTPEFAHGMEIISDIVKEMKDAAGGSIEIPKGLVKMIRVTPKKIAYHHTAKGIKHAVWEVS